jgi:hypothetical protein
MSPLRLGFYMDPALVVGDVYLYKTSLWDKTAERMYNQSALGDLYDRQTYEDNVALHDFEEHWWADRTIPGTYSLNGVKPTTWADVGGDQDTAAFVWVAHYADRISWPRNGFNFGLDAKLIGSGFHMEQASFYSNPTWPDKSFWGYSVIGDFYVFLNAEPNQSYVSIDYTNLSEAGLIDDLNNMTIVAAIDTPTQTFKAFVYNDNDIKLEWSHTFSIDGIETISSGGFDIVVFGNKLNATPVPASFGTISSVEFGNEPGDGPHSSASWGPPVEGSPWAAAGSAFSRKSIDDVVESYVKGYWDYFDSTMDYPYLVESNFLQLATYGINFPVSMAYDTRGYLVACGFSGNAFYPDGAVVVVDIVTDPAKPAHVGEWGAQWPENDPGIKNNDAVIVPYDGLAAVVGDHGVVFIDTSTPSSPTPLSMLSPSTAQWATSGLKSIVYLGSGFYAMGNGSNGANDPGIVFVDATTPSSPTQVGYWDGTGVIDDIRSMVKVPGTNRLIAKTWDVGFNNILYKTIDYTTIGSPATVGTYTHTGAFGDTRDMIIIGDYLYVPYESHPGGDGGGVVAFDISNNGIIPAGSPNGEVYSERDLDFALSIAQLSSTFLVIANQGGNYNLGVVDISTPGTPVLIPDGKGISCGGVGTGGTNFGVVAPGNGYVYYLYSQGDGLSTCIVNIDLCPVIVGSVKDVAVLGIPNGIAMYGRYAVVSRGYSGATNGLTVIDTLDPSTPVVVGSVSTAATLTSGSVAIWGSYAIVAARFSGSAKVVVFDLLDPTDPVAVGSVTDIKMAGSPPGIAMYGDYAIVTGSDFDWVTVVDISTPTAPAVVGSVQDATDLNFALGIAMYGDYAIVCASSGDRVTVVDISTPTAPAVVGSVQDFVHLDQVIGVAMYGQYAIVCTQNSWVTVVDVSTPTAPAVVGFVQDAVAIGSAFEVKVWGDYAVITSNSTDSVTLIDISTPTAPVVVKQLTDPTLLEQPSPLALRGNYAVVGVTADDRVTVVDLANLCP